MNRKDSLMFLMRSNYFAVHDAAAFEAFCERHDLEPITENSEPARRGFLSPRDVMFSPDLEDDFDGEAEETGTEGDWLHELAKHIAGDDVAVVMQIGSDKMRFLTGHAWAVNGQGQTQELDLDEIYNRADALGRLPTLAQY